MYLIKEGDTMNSIFDLIFILAFIGIVSLLCLFSCFLASMSDDYWDELKLEMEKRNMLTFLVAHL